MKELKQKTGKEEGHVVFMLQDKDKYTIRVHSYVSCKGVNIHYDTKEEAEKMYGEL